MGEDSSILLCSADGYLGNRDVTDDSKRRADVTRDGEAFIFPSLSLGLKVHNKQDVSILKEVPVLLTVVLSL